MKIKINSCGINDCSDSWKWITPPDGFSDYDLWAVFRGEGMVCANDEENIPVHDGICLLLSPNQAYRAWHNSANPLFVINVHFDILNATEEARIPTKPQTKVISYPSFLKELLTRVVSFYNSNQKETAVTFFSAALEEFFSSNTPEHTENHGPWTRIANEMATEIDSKTQTPPLSDFAKKYGYTERYIGKMFAAVKRISYSDYTQNSRIGKAKNLLRTTDMPIGEIAEALGFYDACHFAKNFRKIVGTSPLAYRKQKE